MSTTTSTTTSTSTAPSSVSLTASEPSSVSTNLNYFTSPPNNEVPYARINFDPSSPIPRQNWEAVPFSVTITNTRGKEDVPTMDTYGFQFVKHESKEREFRDDEEALQDYYNESIELLKSVTGATKAVIFDHTIRRRALVPTPDTPSTRQPVPRVHVDQTPASALARVHRHLPASEAEQLAKGRFQIVNVWRPIGYAAWDMPLALCDGRTVAPEHLIPTALKYPDRDGQTYSVAHSPAHRWSYLRGMSPSEVALIKCYDSVPVPGGALLTPHTAFEDPTTPKGSRPRQSIELRALVFY